MSLIESQYFLAPCAAAFLFLASAVLEMPNMQRSNAWGQILAHHTLFMSAGILGVGVHFLTFFVVQVTDSGESPRKTVST